MALFLFYDKKNYKILLSIFLFFFLHSCTRDKADPILDYQGYPEAIGNITLTKCAVSGCHNDISKVAAGGLSLTSWAKLFEGTKYNAVVVPYRSEQSTLMFIVNTFTDLGSVLTPTMPYNNSPLTRNEIITIRNWIDDGAPNNNNFVKFSDDASTRSKIYILNQGCDLVAVLDRETKLIMRYFEVGSQPAIESPHFAMVSDNYLYVCFYAGNMFQKFSTENETLVEEVDLGFGRWNTFVITSDSKTAYVVDWNSNGVIAVVDLDKMTLITKYQGSGLLVWPHGSELKDDNTLYVTAQSGNYIYKIDVTDKYNPDFSKIVLQPGESPSDVPKYDPHVLHFSHDKTEYSVTCQRSNEVRFFNAANDSLIAVVPTGKYPQHAHFSHYLTDYMFVTCMEDDINFPGKIGSVTVINFKTHTFIKNIYTGYQPHGIEPDDEKGLVYVANRNVNSNGPSPHHVSNCGGRNGYLTIIDMITLELVPDYKAELSVDPYYITLKE